MMLMETQETSEKRGAEDKLGGRAADGRDTWEAAAADKDDTGKRGHHGVEKEKEGGLSAWRKSQPTSTPEWKG